MMVKKTIEIDENLYEDIKNMAKEEGMHLSRYMANLLKTGLLHNADK